MNIKTKTKTEDKSFLHVNSSWIETKKCKSFIISNLITKLYTSMAIAYSNAMQIFLNS